MHREPVDSCQGRGIEQRRRKNEKLMDSDDSVMVVGVGVEVEVGVGEVNGNGKNNTMKNELYKIINK